MQDKLAQFDRFPPTVVDHTDQSDGVTLHLLDSGTKNDPRVIEIYDNHETEYIL